MLEWNLEKQKIVQDLSIKTRKVRLTSIFFLWLKPGDSQPIKGSNDLKKIVFKLCLFF